MKISDYLAPPDAAAKRTGPKDQIVMSSRVRLARNVAGHSFPGHAKKTERVASYECIRPVIEQVDQLEDAISLSMDKMGSLDKQLLVERHLISREHAAKGAGSGVLLKNDESVSVMINEEDHLRMQALLPGLQINEAWALVDAIDSSLEDGLDYAFSPTLGYLTACPTNLGTGIRVSAMLHLPGLVLSEHVNQIVQAVQKLGLAVRGLYGEGSEALGNVFQISNQMTLGEKEEQIVERLNKVLAQLIEHEENARESLLEKKSGRLFDEVGRAYGILTNAHSIASKETMNLLSQMRLGIDMGFFPGVQRTLVDELFIKAQPAHLQLGEEGKLGAEERDVARARMLRECLSKIDRPDTAPFENLNDLESDSNPESESAE